MRSLTAVQALVTSLALVLVPVISQMPATAAVAAEPSASPPLSPPDQCIGSNPGRVQVNDHDSFGAVSARIIDCSQWPDVTVRVRNEHSFWTKVLPRGSATDAITPINVWAVLGYIPPNAEAEYSIHFNRQIDSTAQFWVNAAHNVDSEDTRPTAAVWTVISRSLGLLGISIEDIADPGLLEQVFDVLGNQSELALAANSLVDGDYVGYVQHMDSALGSDTELELLSRTAALFGKRVAISELKNILTVVRIAQETADLWDAGLAIATGSYAGSVQIESRVAGAGTVSRTTLTITPTSGQPGTRITIVGDGWDPVHTASAECEALAFAWEVSHSTQINMRDQTNFVRIGTRDGSHVQLEFEVPQNAAPGVHRIVPLLAGKGDACPFLQFYDANLFTVTPLGNASSRVAGSTGTSACSGCVILQDDFSDPSSGWPRDTASYPSGGRFLDYVRGGPIVADNEYSVTRGRQTRGLVWAAYPSDFTNFDFTVDGRLMGPASEAYLNIHFRKQTNDTSDGYLFYLRPWRQEYALSVMSANQERELIPWTFNGGIAYGGAVNTIEIRAQDGRISLYVNGQELGGTSDQTFQHGSLALGVGGDYDGVLEARYSNLVVMGVDQ